MRPADPWTALANRGELGQSGVSEGGHVRRRKAVAVAVPGEIVRRFSLEHKDAWEAAWQGSSDQSESGSDQSQGDSAPIALESSRPTGAGAGGLKWETEREAPHRLRESEELLYPRADIPAQTSRWKDALVGVSWMGTEDRVLQHQRSSDALQDVARNAVMGDLASAPSPKSPAAEGCPPQRGKTCQPQGRASQGARSRLGDDDEKDLERKLELLELQRRVCAIKCQKFLEYLEDSMGHNEPFGRGRMMRSHMSGARIQGRSHTCKHIRATSQ